MSQHLAQSLSSNVSPAPPECSSPKKASGKGRRDPGRQSARAVSREPEYPAEARELMQAMRDYQASSGRMFPTWSEVLEVIRQLGYEKSEIAAPPYAPPAAG